MKTTEWRGVEVIYRGYPRGRCYTQPEEVAGRGETARQSRTVQGSREPGSWLLMGRSRQVALEGVELGTGK